MIYQKMLLGDTPYFLTEGSTFSFEKHRHPEIEICYCTGGTYDIFCENKRHTLTEGDLLVIGSMVAHEIRTGSVPTQHIVIEIGYALLGDLFDAFTNQNAIHRIYKRDDPQEQEQYRQMVALIEEIAALNRFDSDVCELSIIGNLYKLSALLLQMLRASQDSHEQIKTLTDVKKIDLALEIIHNQYSEPLVVETVSAVCGYSKSNFCKSFKKITGDTFHNTLNRRRVEVACVLLRQTDDPIEKIAQEAGFADIKSFCRVFKNHTGSNAREYRKDFKTK